MSDLFNAFLKEEDGVETMEFIMLAAVVAALVVVIARIFAGTTKVAKTAEESLSKSFAPVK